MSNEKTIECPDCGRFFSKKGLSNHHYRAHSEKIHPIIKIRKNKEEEYLKNPKYCPECNIVISYSKYKQNNKFCASSCSVSFNNKLKGSRSLETRVKIKETLNIKYSSVTHIKFCTCSHCNKSFIWNSLSKGSFKFCSEDCKTKYTPSMIEKFSKCQMYIRKSENLIKLGFDFLAPFEIEFYRFRNNLIELYCINKESIPNIMKKFNIPSSITIFSLFKLLEISTRNFSEAGKLSLLNGRSLPQSFNPTSNQKWHISWSGQRCFLRSSYEEEYAIFLDENKIEYKTESLRIEYFDSTTNSMRIAIPDFYLPEENKIVEIKASYWYNEKVMQDKFARYKELGYDTMLILDKKPVYL